MPFDFKVKDPKELTPEELIEYFEKLARANLLPGAGFSTVCYYADIKEEVLRRLKGGL